MRHLVVLAMTAAAIGPCASCAMRPAEIPFVAAFIPPPVSTADAKKHARTFLGDAKVYSLSVQPSTNRIVFAEHGLGQDLADAAPDDRVYVAVAMGRFRAPASDALYGRAVILVDAESGAIRASRFADPIEVWND